MKTSILRTRSLAIAAIAVLAPLATPLFAQDAAAAAPPAEPFALHLDAIEFGALDTDVDSNSSRFEEYRDLSSGFWLPRILVSGSGGGDDRYFDFSATNADRSDARYTLGYGVLGRYELTVDYNKIPHRFGNDGHMLWTRTGPGTYELPDPTQAYLQNAIQTQYNTNRAGINYGFLNGLLQPFLATAQEIDLGLERNRLRATLDLGRMGALAWRATYTHEARTGTRPYGASFGFSNATELPEPIDYDTDGAQIAGEWNGKRGGIRVGYEYSSFKNNVPTLYWDNPFRFTSATDPSAYSSPGSGSIGGAAVGFADLAPDNQAGTLFVGGRGKFGAWTANGQVDYIRMKQDDRLLPYTLNAAIVGVDEHGATFDPTNPANLPASRFDGKVDVLNATGNLGTRFADRFSLDFRVRYYDYDNGSSRIEVPGYVRYQAVWEAIARQSVPYAYTRTDASAELGWDLTRTTRLALAVVRESWDREYREVASSDEDTIRLTADSNPLPWLTLRASYDRGKRTTSNYDVEAAEATFVEPEGATNIPSLRRFDEAERDVDAWNLQVQLTPGDAWAVAFSSTGRKESYDAEMGLLDDETANYNVDASYQLAQNQSLYGFYTFGDRDVFQRARQSGATPSTNPLDTWQADFTEKNDTLGLGWNGTFASRWHPDVQVRWTKSDGKADLYSPPGGAPDVAVGFDNYEDIELTAVVATVGYDITDHVSAQALYRYEDFTIDSFILQGLQNYLPGALLLDPNNRDYTANVLGVTLKLAY